jgi:ABC-type multidrug transport system permease subunit
MRLLEGELIVLGLAYVMAAVPVGGVVLAGRVSPNYRLPASDLCRWWSWMALVIAAWLLARTFTG